VPGGKLVAAEFRLAVTTPLAPPSSIPLLEDTLSQTDVLTMDQFSEAALELVRTKFWDDGANGPPF
jgi:hypothetical protein